MQSGGGIQNGENVERVGTHREVEEQRTIMESKETEVEPFIPVSGAYKPQNHSQSLLVYKLAHSPPWLPSHSSLANPGTKIWKSQVSSMNQARKIHWHFPTLLIRFKMDWKGVIMKSAVWPVKEIKWSGWVSDNILSANGEWSGGKDERDTGAKA